MRALAIACFLVAGCLNGNYNGDLGVPQDMAVQLPPPPDMTTLFLFDLVGFDLTGLTNCQELNSCESGKTAAQALMCQQNATPVARAKEGALLSCFKKYCPVAVDMGEGVCAPNDMGKTSASCQTCVNNTYVPAGGACTPAGAPECHHCIHEAEVCTADQ